MNDSNPYTLRFDIWQEAKQNLMDRFYADREDWTNWNSTDIEMVGDSPVPERPICPTAEQIQDEAEKIYAFVQTKS
jgi:hypothetical protein|tara:strand:- start:215 stop:442 length:228 start_codon:yes stop_codon:yes gene_type:complete